MAKSNYYNEDQVTELKLYIENDADLYRQKSVPIFKNLEKKKMKGIYEEDKAEVSFKHLADEGASKYGNEFSAGDGKKIFTPADRREVAKRMREDFEAESEAQGGKAWL